MVRLGSAMKMNSMVISAMYMEEIAPPTFIIKFSKLPGLSAPRLTAGISTIPNQRPAMNPPPSPAKSIPAKSIPAG